MIETNLILHGAPHAFGQPSPDRSTVVHSDCVGIVLKQNNFATMALPFMKFLLAFRDRSQTLVRGADAKRGPFKLLTLVRGENLKKITTDSPLKIEFTCFSMGLTRNFHGKKRGPGIFCGLKGGPKNFRDKYFFAWGPPYKCLRTVPYREEFSEITKYKHIQAMYKWLTMVVT